MTRREMLATAGTALAWMSTSGLPDVGAQALPALENMGGEGVGPQ
jgi:hypothetical protein